jgi:integrase
VIDLSPPGHQPQSLVILLRARRDGRNPQYYARRIVPLRFRKTPRNPYVLKALGAVSLERAKELAWQWWTSTELKIKQEEPLRDDMFSGIARSYLNELERRKNTLDKRNRPIVNVKKYARHEQSIRLHLNPFFGSMPVGQIRSDDAERWLEWRTSPRASGAAVQDEAEVTAESRLNSFPARSTVQKDAVAFAAVVRHARLSFKVDTRFVPELPLQAQTVDTRRPRFYPKEWQRIVKLLRDRAVSNKGKSGTLSMNSFWFRSMLYYFVMTLHGTGLRVAEAMRLKVKDLHRVTEDAARLDAYEKQLRLTFGKNYRHLSDAQRETVINDQLSKHYDYRVKVSADFQLKHYTHERTVIPLAAMTIVFDNILQLLLRHLPKELIGDISTTDLLPPELWLFCHLDGRRIKSFDHGFDAVLGELDLLHCDGKKRSLTSIRHTYASERIEARSADLKSIADNMGTTVEMLYKHYSQEIRELRAAELQVI